MRCGGSTSPEDPVDVIELGSRQRPVGSITAVKMLGMAFYSKNPLKIRQAFRATVSLEGLKHEKNEEK